MYARHQNREASILGQSLSGAKTIYQGSSMSGEAYVIPLNNTPQLQPLATQGLRKPKVASVDSINVHY